MGLQLTDDIEMEDEQAQIRKAKAAVHKDGKEEIRDFETALRIARQDSVAAGPAFTGARDDGYNARRNALFNKALADHETSTGRTTTRAQ
jgi:hypothetical protein